ncbi:hypothetical protein [Nocardia sp. NRRL S-836]|uniref:hypothetical protein n=1 Tax=Nocardia sp. NRRL S-836 TaxID=1519492 RepID=UPI0006ADECDA|nr:hypothetical protein [Nocardia sp. NRRL S-836]KOV84622.1 hypothetical protein ADL03_15095 [Nocardia sp. NRRL S-836]
MRFTLFYDGDLPPAGSRSDTAEAKHQIRKDLHPQIKEVWTTSGLEDVPGLIDPSAAGGGQHLTTVRDTLRGAFTFASVVHPYLHLRASLNILMLRSGPAGLLIDSGDIDNRLKTLFDALTVPSAQQIPKGWAPNPDEEPLHCLLEDDRLITSVAVETERLLGQPIAAPRAVRLTIRVHVYAARASYDAQSFITP